MYEEDPPQVTRTLPFIADVAQSVGFQTEICSSERRAVVGLTGQRP